MSSTYCPVPRSNRRSSRRVIACPIPYFAIVSFLFESYFLYRGSLKKLLRGPIAVSNARLVLAYLLDDVVAPT
jgi:hypothetical protein